jgi:mono/diheme cytochrome c family protein
MRAILFTVLGATLLCAAFDAGWAQADAPQDAVARGKALVDAADCASCHTADPAKPLAGGKRIDTPFGGIFSPNLTPDRDTGLGAWTDDEFYRALHDGIARNGARYYPAFPYPNFTRMTREDVLAIRAYLATLAPVRNTAPPPQLRFPLNYRVVMRAWNWLFFRPGTFEKNPQKSDEWNRGAYLVEGAAHCGACHTPKNMFGADKRGQAYGGGLVDGWFAPRLDGAERSGLKSWSVEDIAEYLQSGRNGKSHAGKLMAEVVVNSTSKMSDADVRAMAVYLKDLPAGMPEPAVTPPHAGANDGWCPNLPGLRRLPRGRRHRLAAHLSAAARQRQFAIHRSFQHASHHPRRRADRDHAARAQHRFDAGLFQEIDGPGDRRCRDLHPQRMGQCRACGDVRAGGEGAARKCREPALTGA